MHGSEFDADKLQIKNSNLHIVTEFKVCINSLSAFGFRYLGGGMGLFIKWKWSVSLKAVMILSTVWNFLLFLQEKKLIC